jgi:hypothetical protein
MSPDTNLLFESVDKYFKSHYYYGKPLCSYYITPFTDPNNESQIFKAIKQVIDCLIFYKYRSETILKESDKIHSFHPIIVFDGDLFSAKINDNEKNIEEENHIQLLVMKEFSEPITLKWSTNRLIDVMSKSYVIDVVKKEYFDEFLKNFE